MNRSPLLSLPVSLVVLSTVVMASACAGTICPYETNEDDECLEPEGETGPQENFEVVSNPDGSSTVTVNAGSATAWVYLDLGELAVMEPADPANSADWDLGLQRFHYALDGGVSGLGLGALVVVDGTELDDVTEVPEEGWVTDEADDPEDEDALPEYAFETAEGGWYDYNPMNHVLTPKPRLYVVRGAEGEAYALRIDSYYNNGNSAWPKFTIKPLDAPAAAR